MGMSKAEVERAALSLAPMERLEIATVLLESVELEAIQPRLPQWQRTLLDERIAEDDAGRDPGRPWAEVRREIPWAGMLDDPAAPPARELESILEAEWPEAIDRDRS